MYPLRASDARRLIRRLLLEGKLVLPGEGSHARREMEKDRLDNNDILNVLRGGQVCEAEWDNGGWRHQVKTPRMVFVVVFDPEPITVPGDDDDISELELLVVTGWRLRQ